MLTRTKGVSIEADATVGKMQNIQNRTHSARCRLPASKLSDNANDSIIQFLANGIALRLAFENRNVRLQKQKIKEES